jgi:hypothetical protein
MTELADRVSELTCTEPRASASGPMSSQIRQHLAHSGGVAACGARRVEILFDALVREIALLGALEKLATQNFRMLRVRCGAASAVQLDYAFAITQTSGSLKHTD